MKNLTPAEPNSKRLADRPLDPLAHLMVVDSRPGYPMCMFLECRVGGSLSEDRFAAAVRIASARHPNIRSRLVWRFGRPRWRDAGWEPAILWHPETSAEQLWGPIDLERESGVRFVVLPDAAEGCRVILYAHHAVCDGLAACQLLGDIWTLYHGADLEPLASASEPAEDLPLQEAGEAAGPLPARPLAERLSAVAAEAVRFARFRPARIAVLSEDVSSTSAAAARPPYAVARFDAATVERLRAWARKHDASLNDLVLAASMRALVAWNEAAGGRLRGGVRVTMPVNLRTSDARLPAANHLGYAFLDRTLEQCRDADELVGSLAAATQWIKENGAAGMFITALRQVTKIPGLLRLITRFPACFSTAVVSNLGNAAAQMRALVPCVDGHLAPGGVVLRGVFGTPPVRPRTEVAIALSREGDRLIFTCLTASDRLGPAAAGQILQAVQEACLEIAAESSL